jgi:hypothetical protein
MQTFNYFFSLSLGKVLLQWNWRTYSPRFITGKTEDAGKSQDFGCGR